jgi:hypothetical protein
MAMEAYICRTCGVQYAPTQRPPARCPICEDERQYVGWDGQRWATMAELLGEGRRNTLRQEEPDLWSIGTEPQFAIGQRTLLVRTPDGNVMWDCISLVDDASVAEVRELGGLRAIAISHPHFYGSMVTWSAAFGDCPIYVHAADREWVQYPTPAVRYWEGLSHEVLPGLALLNPGGHFEGAAVLHWAAGADGRGALLSGDTVTVVMDRRYVRSSWTQSANPTLDRSRLCSRIGERSPSVVEWTAGGRVALGQSLQAMWSGQRTCSRRVSSSRMVATGADCRPRGRRRWPPVGHLGVPCEASGLARGQRVVRQPRLARAGV